MQRILPPPRTLPLYDTAATRAIEHAAAAALPPHALMLRAGRAVARLALAIAPHARQIWVAAGPGNNGGDGLDAAIHLLQAGRSVGVTLFGDESRLPDDARDALARARAAGVVVTPAAADGFADLDADDLAIDALLGIGAQRAPEGPLAAAVARLATLPCPVLAVDLPSGLSADTGRRLGAAVVRADHTLSLLTLKPGLFTGDARDQAGTVWFDDLGVDASGALAAATLAGLDLIGDAWPPRRHGQHKGSFGDLAVVGGAAGMTGAALLAGRAAAAAGAGRVYVQLLDGGSIGHDVLRPELMFRPAGGVLAVGTVVCGCGGGAAVAAVLPRWLSTAPRLVLDADALNAIAADSALAALLAARAGRGNATVLTPHPLEAARLLGTDAATVQADRLGAARELAGRLRCVVVLKGSGTVVAAPLRRASINATGSASLASAGTGDVLAGWLGGAWSQRVGGDPPIASDPDAIAFDAAVAAVALHGLAAQATPVGPLRASDLIEAIVAARAQAAAGRG